MTKTSPGRNVVPNTAATAGASASQPDWELGREVLREGEHPFGTRFARRHPILRFDPSIYLDALMQRRTPMARLGRTEELARLACALEA